MAHIVVSGFEAFDGRPRNASWIAAQRLVATHRSLHVLHALKLPVCWGAAQAGLCAAALRWRPAMMLAMGEGTPGEFRLETRALNARTIRKDNAGALPLHALVDPAGPAELEGEAPYVPLRKALMDTGYPVTLSRDAGGFLCAEAQYTLEQLTRSHPDIQLALFIHLPPFGSAFTLAGKTVSCDEEHLAHFSHCLLNATIPLLSLKK